jgi:hypothetical protein
MCCTGKASLSAGSANGSSEGQRVPPIPAKAPNSTTYRTANPPVKVGIPERRNRPLGIAKRQGCAESGRSPRSTVLVITAASTTRKLSCDALRRANLTSRPNGCIRASRDAASAFDGGEYMASGIMKVLTAATALLLLAGTASACPPGYHWQPGWRGPEGYWHHGICAANYAGPPGCPAGTFWHPGWRGPYGAWHHGYCGA